MSYSKVKVAIIGVGNCASSFVQGVRYYREAKDGGSTPGLMHPYLGPYHVSDIDFTAAFDVAETKVGRPLAEAIFAQPNNTPKFSPPPESSAVVYRGEVLDGLGKYLAANIRVCKTAPVNVSEILRRTETEVVVSYLPVGSEKATRWYAEQVLEAGCAFVNCIPVFIASDKDWRRRFEAKKLPLIGDDIKSQVGATIVHRVLTNLFRERGVRLERTYQLNFGGNTDFLNMLERDRLESKKRSKTESVLSQLPERPEENNVHVGPSDYVPWLKDQKICYIRMEGTTFGGQPLNCELKLEVWDSPNSAGVVIDAVRCAKLGLDRGVGGALTSPCAYFMKSPPRQFTDQEARAKTEDFIRGLEVR